jgi:hypothetical protein
VQNEAYPKSPFPDTGEPYHSIISVA